MQGSFILCQWHHLESEHCHEELFVALKNDKKIFPVVIKRTGTDKRLKHLMIGAAVTHSDHIGLETVEIKQM